MKDKLDTRLVVVVTLFFIATAIYVSTLLGIGLILFEIVGVIGMFMHFDDQKYNAIFERTHVTKSRTLLYNAGYEPLTNVLANSRSLRTPRPGKVIQDYELQGYKVELCPVAVDRYGREIDDPNAYSVWGSLKLIS